MRLLIADDHTMVREGLSRAMELAGFHVVAQAADGEAAATLAEEHEPDVVIMDLSLPVLSGAAATKRIRKSVPATAVLVLSMLSDDSAVASALGAGAKGYMVKDCTTEELVDAVRRVGSGQVVISPSVSQSLAAATKPATKENHQPLVTRREEEILRLMATGVSIPEAARQLYISVKTVKNHLSSIYQKLDCHDRAQAVLKAIRMGLITLD